jgi:hypothetical protein
MLSITGIEVIQLLCKIVQKRLDKTIGVNLKGVWLCMKYESLK